MYVNQFLLKRRCGSINTLADLTINNSAETIYYPIQFSADDAGYTIEPGNRYIVTLTLRGDVNAGEGGGTSDPEQPLINSPISITVTAASWTPVTVDKTFN